MSARWRIVLALLASAAAVSVGQTRVVDRVAASVNDIAIPESAVRRAVLLAPLDRSAGESEDAFRSRVLEALIDQSLQYEDAMRFGPSPPDAAEVDAAVAKLRVRLASEGKDPSAEFAKAQMTADDVRASVERQLVVARYLQERFRPLAAGDESSAQSTFEGDVEKWVRELREKARITIYPVPGPSESGPATVLATAPAATRTPTGP